MLKSKVLSGEIDPDEVIKAANERYREVHAAEAELTKVLDCNYGRWTRDMMLPRAYNDARKHKRKTKDEQEFEMLEAENLTKLAISIVTKKYKPSRGIAFINYKPVIREIYAAPFRDRIVHHFLYNQSAEVWDKWFINDSYSCRKGKGTLYGIKRIHKFIRQASKGGRRKAFVLKFDIQSYFMSLDRRKLYKTVKEALKRQFPDHETNWRYDLLLYLWREVIFDDPVEGVFRRGNEKDWEIVPKGKRLDLQPLLKGIVIGNLTSQLLSNLYLDKLDHFVVEKLGWKRYGRYVDDFVIVVTEAELDRAKRDRAEIVRFLWEELGLRAHPFKMKTVEVHQGVEFLGTVIYPTHVVPARRFRQNMFKAMVEYNLGIGKKESLDSYLGLVKHYNSRKLIRRMFEKAKELNCVV